MVLTGRRKMAKEVKINVYRDGTEWFAARWIDGEYDGSDSLEISDDASDAEAIEAAEALMPQVSGQRLIARVEDIDSTTGQVP
jgi:hypothetical protein